MAEWSPHALQYRTMLTDPAGMEHFFSHFFTNSPPKNAQTKAELETIPNINWLSLKIKKFIHVFVARKWFIHQTLNACTLK